MLTKSEIETLCEDIRQKSWCLEEGQDPKESCIFTAMYFAEEGKTLINVEDMAVFSVEDGQWCQSEATLVVHYFKIWWETVGKEEHEQKEIYRNTPRDWVITFMDMSTDEWKTVAANASRDKALNLEQYKDTPLLKTEQFHGTWHEVTDHAYKDTSVLTPVGIKAVDIATD